MFKKTIYLLPLATLLFSLSGCSSLSSQNTALHEYDNSSYFGVISDAYTDDEASYITRLTEKEGTFLAEDWEKPEEVIEYKYMDDPKFYAEDELPENKGRLGNVIVKVPENVSKEKFLARLESGQVSY